MQRRLLGRVAFVESLVVNFKDVARPELQVEATNTSCAARTVVRERERGVLLVAGRGGVVVLLLLVGRGKLRKGVGGSGCDDGCGFRRLGVRVLFLALGE